MLEEARPAWGYEGDVTVLVTTNAGAAGDKKPEQRSMHCPDMKWYPHQDSNLELILRRDPLYPV